MKLITVLFVVLATLRGTSAVSSADKRAIVKLHNKFRGEASPSAAYMMKLRWNDKLAKSAQDYINKCKMGHDGNEERKTAANIGVSVGQNLAYGQQNWNDAVTAWHNEISNFTYTKGGGAAKKTVGHFTQMMLSRSTHVGCGYKTCPGQYKRHYACNYAQQQSPAETLTPWKRGQSCSECGGKCSGNVCDCGNKICQNGGTLDPKTCKCVCSDLYKGSALCDKANCKPDAEVCKKPQPYGFKGECQASNVPPLCPHMCGKC